MTKTIIATNEAPQAIGTYSQAVQKGGMVFVSGQIPLDPNTMQMVADDFISQAHQVFTNLLAVLSAADCKPENVLKLTIYMTDLSNFNDLNEVMGQYFQAPFPSRAAVEVSALPKAARVEIEAIASR